MKDIKRRVELAQRSNQRVLDALELPESPERLNFIIKEAWIGVRRAVEIWLHFVFLDKK